jgi:glycine hydroxymethyltransferase
MDEVVTALSKGDAEDVIARVHHEVSELTAQFPAPGL